MTLADELRMLLPLAREMGLRQAVARLETYTRPCLYQWEKRPTWYRFTKRFPRFTPPSDRQKVLVEMRDWCRNNAMGHYSWRSDAATFAFEQEQDAVHFALAFEVERVEWK